jgi:hypothetical protein
MNYYVLVSVVHVTRWLSGGATDSGQSVTSYCVSDLILLGIHSELQEQEMGAEFNWALEE